MYVQKELDIYIYFAGIWSIVYYSLLHFDIKHPRTN